MNRNNDLSLFDGTLHQGIAQRSVLVFSQVDDWIMMNLAHAWTGYTVEQVAGQISWLAKARRDARSKKGNASGNSPSHDSDEEGGLSEYWFPGPEEDPADLQPCDEASESGVEVAEDFSPAYFSFDSGKPLRAEQSIASCPAPGIVLVIHNSDLGPDWARSMFCDNLIIESFREADDFVPD